MISAQSLILIAIIRFQGIDEVAGWGKVGHSANIVRPADCSYKDAVVVSARWGFGASS
jgi:hypothetical protein